MSTDDQERQPPPPLAGIPGRSRLLKRVRTSTSRQPSDLDAERNRSIDGVLALLDQNRPHDATRAFTITWARYGAPPNENARDWLIGACDPRRIKNLIQAYAVESCPYCQCGLDPCIECGGHGHLDHESICEDCVGFGVVPCSFCGGSGWLTLEAIPQPLRPAVMLERAALAVARIQGLREEGTTSETDDDPARVLRRCAHAAARLNGLIGVLENEVAAAQELQWWSPRSPQQRHATVRSWVELACTVERDVHGLFARMSEAARRMAATAPPDSPRQRLAQSRREASESLGEPGSFARTCFDHATLSRIAGGLSREVDGADSGAVANRHSVPSRPDGDQP